MQPNKRPWVAIVKVVLASAILAIIGRQFYRDLTSEQISTVTIRFPWLIASAVVYLVAIGFSGIFWLRLLHLFEQPVAFLPAMKAYYIGHLGKYVPGKAWALWLRGDFVRGPGVSMSVCIVTAFYEVLTTMATGALVAAVVFFIQPPEFMGIPFPPYLTGLFLLGLCGVPLLPGVFNLLAQRMARRFEALGAFHVPRLRLPVLAQGIVLIGAGWALMGLSVWFCLCGVIEPAPELTAATLASYSAIIGLAYVIGFVAFMLPSGIGAREWVLTEFLHFAGPRPAITAGVLLLRLSWTTAEVLLAALMAMLIRR